MVTGLSYLLVSITVAVILGLAGRQRHDSSDKLDVYFYPPVLLWVLAFLTPLPGALGAFLYLTWPPSHKPTGLGLTALIAISGCAILVFLCVYWNARMYRVELTDRELTIRNWLNSRRIALGDVADTNVFDGRTVAGGTRRLVVYLRNGQKLSIPGTLTDFDDLAGSLQSKIDHGQAGRSAGNVKLMDVEASTRNKSRENVVAYIGLAIVAIALLIVWKLA